MPYVHTYLWCGNFPVIYEWKLKILPRLKKKRNSNGVWKSVIKMKLESEDGEESMGNPVEGWKVQEPEGKNFHSR